MPVVAKQAIMVFSLKENKNNVNLRVLRLSRHSLEPLDLDNRRRPQVGSLVAEMIVGREAAGGFAIKL